MPKDIAFALDSSGSIGKQNFEQVVNFAKDVVGRLPVEHGTNVGMITYGDNNTVNDSILELHIHIDYKDAGYSVFTFPLQNVYTNLDTSIRL